MSLQKRAREISTQQHGVIGFHQLRADGTRSAIRHELETSGRWQRVVGPVFQLIGSPFTDLSRAMAGVLSYGPGSVVSHHTAAWLWQWPGFVVSPVHLVRPKSSNSRSPMAGTVRHESRRMPFEDLAVISGLSVTSPARTLVDISPFIHPDRLERLLDHAWSRRLVDAASQLECCERLGERGRPGVRLLRSLVSAWGSDWIAPASGLESRVNATLAEAGIGQVARQVNIGGATWLGRVDFLHASGVVLEVQSEMFHSSHTSMLDDLRRARAMEAAGYSVVEAWEHDVWHNSDIWLTRFRRAIDARRPRSA